MEKGAVVFIILIAAVSGAAGTIYVDNDAPPSGDGSSWANAYKYLQDALTDANTSEKPVEIRVAQGVYTPDRGAGITPGDRSVTFQLINNVTLKGGYAAFPGQEPDIRDVNLYETILSGDLNDDDCPPACFTEPEDWPDCDHYTENSYHIVTADGTGPTAVLDGFTLTHGMGGYGSALYNDSGSPTINDCTFTENVTYMGGAAMYNNNASPTLNNCTFIHNMAVGDDVLGGALFNGSSNPKFTGCIFESNKVISRFSGGGGAMWNFGGSPMLVNCTFSANSLWVDELEVSRDGSAIANEGGEPILIGCTFSGNYAHYGGGTVSNSGGAATVMDCIFTGNYGGGIVNSNDSPIVTRSIFTGNDGYCGGGMLNHGGFPVVTDCIFGDNSALYDGGGMWNYESEPIIIGCSFTGNSAGGKGFGHDIDGEGGGMFNYGGSQTLVNCTFSGNWAMGPTGCGGGIYGEYMSSTSLINCTLADNNAVSGAALYVDEASVESANCIFWNISDEFFSHDGVISIVYSDVKGGWPGKGNIDTDPCLARAGYRIDAEPDYYRPGRWFDGDYHLKSKTGRWDPNEGRWTMDDVTSPCIDAGDPMSPIGLEPFPNGGIVNMGAYGGTNEAGKSYFGGPPCETIVAGDINGDCVINFLDFQLMALHWCEDNGQ